MKKFMTDCQEKTIELGKKIGEVLNPGDVVLLTGSFVNDQKENKIKKVKLDILKQNGVNVCRVLEYAVINNQEFSKHT